MRGVPARRPWLVVLLLLAPCAGRGELPPLPEGTGRDVVERSCSQCHSLETVLRSRLSRRQWAARIDEMVAKGAKLTDDEIDVVAEYLGTNFGPVGN